MVSERGRMSDRVTDIDWLRKSTIFLLNQSASEFKEMGAADSTKL